jgi:transposase
VYIGDVHYPFALLDYTPTHHRDGPERILRGFKGFLQADALLCYNQLYTKGEILEVGCWAHARRKFIEAKGSDPGNVRVALGYIAELYHLESTWKPLTDEERQAARQQYALPKLHAFRA